jgi:RNA polymerase sigma-70 factor (ECF subfamily)
MLQSTITMARPGPADAPVSTADPEPTGSGSTADEILLAEVKREHGRALFGFLLRLTNGDQQRAEDLLQESLLRAWRHPHALRAENQSMRPWLLTVSRRLAIDAHRARLARPPEVRYDALGGAEPSTDPIERSMTALDVRRALQDLDPPHRQVLIEIYFRGLSVAETAEKLQIPQGTVKSRSYYALRQLRGILRGYDQTR